MTLYETTGFVRIRDRMFRPSEIFTMEQRNEDLLCRMSDELIAKAPFVSVTLKADDPRSLGGRYDRRSMVIRIDNCTIEEVEQELAKQMTRGRPVSPASPGDPSLTTGLSSQEQTAAQTRSAAPQTVAERQFSKAYAEGK
jgi:hypothetical protein